MHADHHGRLHGRVPGPEHLLLAQPLPAADGELPVRNGTCIVDSSQPTCLANGAGSEPGGVGTTCATFMCPAATGSCCDAGGICTAKRGAKRLHRFLHCQRLVHAHLLAMTRWAVPGRGPRSRLHTAQCSAVSGTFQGIGTTLAANPAPPSPARCGRILHPDGRRPRLPRACRRHRRLPRRRHHLHPDRLNRASGANLVAKYDFDVNVLGGGSRNLTFTTSVTGPFPDRRPVRRLAQRYVDPNLPFGLLDDSVFLFSGDNQGVIPESKVDSRVGVVDLFDQIVPANPGTATATWTFDISGFNNLAIAIDAAAMGDFESAPIADFFTFTVAIDGGSPVIVFNAGADEAADLNYTMANGNVITVAVRLSSLARRLPPSPSTTSSRPSRPTSPAPARPSPSPSPPSATAPTKPTRSTTSRSPARQSAFRPVRAAHRWHMHRLPAGPVARLEPTRATAPRATRARSPTAPAA